MSLRDIARDMHDHVLQRLYGVGLAMQTTGHRATTPETAARITDHMNQLQQIIREIRTAIYDLSPDPAGTAPLRSTLRQVITELTADAPLHATVAMSGPLDLVPPGLAHHAQAVVREAVSNAVRHAHARQLTVTIAVEHPHQALGGRIVLQHLRILAERTFAADLIDYLAQHSGIQPGLGRRTFNRVARFAVRLAQRRNRFFSDIG